MSEMTSEREAAQNGRRDAADLQFSGRENKDNKLTSSQWPPVTKALSCSGGVLALIPAALDAADTGLLFFGGDGQALSRQESYWRQVRPGEMTP